MPISYRIDKDLGLLTVIGSDSITDEDIVAYKNALQADADLPHVTKEISDFRETSYAVSPKRIPDVARLHEEVFGEAQSTRCAVLVSSDLRQIVS